MTGGTASLAFGDTVFRISKQGQDDRNLGRWTWMTLTGKMVLTQQPLTVTAAHVIIVDKVDLRMRSNWFIWHPTQMHSQPRLLVLEICLAMISKNSQQNYKIMAIRS